MEAPPATYKGPALKLELRDLKADLSQEFGKFMDTAEFVSFGKDADYWIYPSPDWNTIFTNFKDDLKDFKSVKNQQVFDTEGSGQGTWFEQRLANLERN